MAETRHSGLDNGCFWRVKTYVTQTWVLVFDFSMCPTVHVSYLAILWKILMIGVQNEVLKSHIIVGVSRVRHVNLREIEKPVWGICCCLYEGFEPLVEVNRVFFLKTLIFFSFMKFSMCILDNQSYSDSYFYLFSKSVLLAVQNCRTSFSFIIRIYPRSKFTPKVAW